MGSEINPNPKPPEPPPQQEPQGNQPKPDAKDTGKPQSPEGPQEGHMGQLGRLQLGKGQDQIDPLPQDFMETLEMIFQEGYEEYKPPPMDRGAGVFSESGGKEFTKDMQIIRQFMKDAEHLLGKQGIELHQLLTHLKAQQGGTLWQKLQQVLQKGLPTQAKAGAKAGLAAGEGDPGLGGPRGELAQLNPGRAMLEMIRAEVNPKGQLEHMAIALQILKQDGMEKSSEKLMSYLRNRWGMSEEEFRRFIVQQNIAYFQGPSPREKRSPTNFWYLLIAIISVPLAILMGMDALDSVFVGLTAAILIFIVVMMNKK